MTIDIQKTELDGVMVLKGNCFHDSRGYFCESYNKRDFASLGISQEFVQENHARSKKGVLRGIHLQDTTAPMGKLVRCTLGTVVDIVVDLRLHSTTFGKWTAVELSAENRNQLFVPEGFGHSYQAIEDDVEVQYKCTSYYVPKSEVTIKWNDHEIDITWPITPPILSPKDATGISLSNYRSHPNSFSK